MSDTKSAAFGLTIQLFLVDGTPDGLVIASIHGWTGSVLVSTQTTFARLLARPEVARTGIYVLHGPDPEDALKRRAYIGEADSVKKRIILSANEHKFWETAVVVTTSDEGLIKGHVRYLEARLIEMARHSGRVFLDNTQEPSAGGIYLPESDRNNMEAFLAKLSVILPVIGLELLKPRPMGLHPQPGEARFEIRHKGVVIGAAVEEGGEFVVLAGSRATKGAGHRTKGYYRLRKKLINSGVLVVTTDGTAYEFRNPHGFKSPSAAAAVILDRNANGRTEWTLVGTKKTYHEWQQINAGLKGDAG